MAYFNGCAYTGRPEITEVLCDPCLRPEEYCSLTRLRWAPEGQAHPMQKVPWRWAPVYGRRKLFDAAGNLQGEEPTLCARCGLDVDRPEARGTFSVPLWENELDRSCPDPKKEE